MKTRVLHYCYICDDQKSFALMDSGKYRCTKCKKVVLTLNTKGRNPDGHFG